MKLRHIYYAIRYEPKRILCWWHTRDLLTGKRFTLKEAIRATIENPVGFEYTYDGSLENSLTPQKGKEHESKIREEAVRSFLLFLVRNTTVDGISEGGGLYLWSYPLLEKLAEQHLSLEESVVKYGDDNLPPQEKESGEIKKDVPTVGEKGKEK